MDPVTVALVRWCLTEGADCRHAEKLLAGFAEACDLQGIRIDRLMFTLRTLHPQLVAVGWFWERGEPFVQREYRHKGVSDQAFLSSPVKPLLEGKEQRIRVPLTGPEAERYPIAMELHARGFTDYLAFALRAGDGRPNVMTLASKAAGGMAEEQVLALEAALPAVGLLLDRQALRLIARNVCTTYIGEHTGRRVLDGEIQRGAVERLRAAVWFADLRGFTARSLDLGVERTVELLNLWFGVVGEAVHAEGGEILKFIGDAALVVFPVRDGHDGPACRAALATARRTLEGVAALGAPDGLPIRFGVGLHIGEVAYGNIGAVDRLDFTVIGHAVNLAARLEALAGERGEPLLTSRAFAEASGEDLDPIGRYPLKGIPEPVEVYRLPR